ncbi:hypothetical protein [Nonomuraea insulae]|uniref:Uncharacterized protein n=1 Tax=Nonomuraea insulae TaxID=1616787 RepID=A0ABW1CDZ2_9ACTN
MFRITLVAAVVASFALTAQPAAADGATYYVDATAGDDSGPGTDEAHPWKRVSEDGTADATYQIKVTRPHDGSTSPPARATLSTSGAWLGDGSYDVTMNLWYGANAGVFILYENGKEIARRDLTLHTPSPQKATVAVTGRRNGVYVYTGELVNQVGRTPTTSVKVEVTHADPGEPVLSGDNWDGDGDYTIRMNMWWGTNATTYRLYEDGVLVDTRQLAPATPAAQSAATVLTGRPAGRHTYVAELVNEAGATSSEPLTVMAG